MLAYNLRPKTFEDFIGQEHLAGEEGVIRRLVEQGKVPSMIFWGPPGSGKTSLAEIIANSVDADFVRLSAVMDGKEKLKTVLDQAELAKDQFERTTIVFIDEIHRWNKAQQDALLPYVERGDIILIGATTENPSFEVISALLSRVRVFVFEPHTVEDIYKALVRVVEGVIPAKAGILDEGNSTNISPERDGSGVRAITLDQAEKDDNVDPSKAKSLLSEEVQSIKDSSATPQNDNSGISLRQDSRLCENDTEPNTPLSRGVSPERVPRRTKYERVFATGGTLHLLAEISNGDMRFALNALESALNLAGDGELTKEIIEQSIQKTLRYDKDGEEHYNLISAVHKSMRSSNPSAAAYWVMRMLDGGEDPLYVARRLLRFASEDIGNASPTALLLANSVYDTCHKLGMPECNVALVQLAEYLARAPKDNRAYKAVNKIQADIKKYGNLPVPLHLRNAPTKLMKDLDYGKGYEYDHDLPDKKSDQECLPKKLKGRDYFG